MALTFSDREFSAWTEEDLKLIKIVQNIPMLYDPIVTDVNKLHYWPYVAKRMDMPDDYCRKRWNSLLNSYITMKQNISLGVQVCSPLMDGTLKFLDKPLRLNSNLNDNRELSAEGLSSKYIVTLDTIENLLKHRQDRSIMLDPNDTELINLVALVNFKLTEALTQNSTATNAVINTAVTENEPTYNEVIEVIDCEERNDSISEIGDNLMESDASPPLLANPIKRVGNDENIQTIEMSSEKDNSEASQAICMKFKGTKGKKEIRNPLYKIKANKNSNELLLHNCNDSKTSVFLKNLGDYIVKNFTEKQQMELRLKICSLVTDIELGQ